LDNISNVVNSYVRKVLNVGGVVVNGGVVGIGGIGGIGGIATTWGRSRGRSTVLTWPVAVVRVIPTLVSLVSHFCRYAGVCAIVLEMWSRLEISSSVTNGQRKV